jgi:hypothetical protein
MTCQSSGPIARLAVNRQQFSVTSRNSPRRLQNDLLFFIRACNTRASVRRAFRSFGVSY